MGVLREDDLGSQPQVAAPARGIGFVFANPRGEMRAKNRAEGGAASDKYCTGRATSARRLWGNTAGGRERFRTLRGKPCVLASGTPDGPEARRVPWPSLASTAQAYGRRELGSGAAALWEHG